MQNRRSPTLASLVDSFTREILGACQRHYAQFAKISALADAIERGPASPCERDALFALLMETAIHFELNAQTDVDAFRRIHHGVLRSLLDGHRHEDVPADAVGACVHTSPVTSMD